MPAVLGRRPPRRDARILGRSAAMLAVLGLIDRLGPHSFPVLIQGETGTGKELVAQALHAARGNGRPPVILNCANLTDSLSESQLFGHEAGAFTGARRRHRGAIERAHGGTLFLDEIAELAPRDQTKLLRVLESGEFQRLGSERMDRADFRLLAATSRNLEELADRGDFRPDLYYRLGAAVIALPPLRQRREDIPLLAQQILDAVAKRRRVPAHRLTRGVLRILISHPWPGNVRQLKSVLETAAALGSDGVIEAEVIAGLLNGTGGAGPRESEASLTLRAAVERAEAAGIARALREAGGQVDEAAKLLDISPATLYRKMKTNAG